jgi:hypothetical protein
MGKYELQVQNHDDYADQKQEFDTERKSLERKYSYYYPTRDFRIDHEEEIEKKENDDGTYTNNGYR